MDYGTFFVSLGGDTGGLGCGTGPRPNCSTARPNCNRAGERLGLGLGCGTASGTETSRFLVVFVSRPGAGSGRRMTYSNTATESSKTNKVTMHALRIHIGGIPENLKGWRGEPLAWVESCPALREPGFQTLTAPDLVPLVSGNEADRV